MKILFTFLLAINIYALELQKPKVYDKNKHEINGWHMSEKLDGIRAYWDGKKLISKNGNKINAPKWFIKNFPKFELDGELWTKRNDFENIQNIVMDKKPSLQWKKITYNIFEAPNQKGNFDKRLVLIKKWQMKNRNDYIKIIKQVKCKNKKHLNEYLEKLVKKKAEGIILKNPKLKYFKGRSSNILKVKKFFDMEGKIIGFNYDENSRLKSLILELKNGIRFNLGGGLNKKERINHQFNLGQNVTFKYYGFTKYSKPKFASFLRVREKE